MSRRDAIWLLFRGRKNQADMIYCHGLKRMDEMIKEKRNVPILDPEY